ncbi:MAG: acetyl-CoA carboxylase carboxyl transferase subunit alpha, partial [Flavobacteriales bacterium]|nr:acetyl-CoA carboxylase carboxyl transferase subunit alpha [Flavobacteriales bacterium]
MIYLDFEKPIEELVIQLEKTREINKESKVDVKETVKRLEKKIEDTRKQVYGKLTAWQRVQMSRHPERPYSLKYIQNMTDEGSFVELHGDRTVKDDKAIIGGFASIEGRSMMFIGHQKG